MTHRASACIFGHVPVLVRATLTRRYLVLCPRCNSKLGSYRRHADARKRIRELRP